MAKAYDIAARIRVDRKNRRAYIIDLMLSSPRRANATEAERQTIRDRSARGVPPSLEIAKEALAFWEEWTGTRFAQPVAEALPGWNLAACRQFVADDGDWDTM